MIVTRINAMDTIRHEFYSARERLNESRKELNRVKEYTFEQWRADKQQLQITFDN